MSEQSTHRKQLQCYTPYHGHSALTMARLLDEIGLSDSPLLCVDAFVADSLMWAVKGNKVGFEKGSSIL